MGDRTPMWRRYVRFFGSDPAADVHDELEFHLQERTDQLIAQGLAPLEARREAERRLGDRRAISQEVAQADRVGRRRERVRDWGRNLLLSLRRLRREPGFAAVAIATLALGIGAAVGVFAVVDAVVLRPLPYPEPDRLVQISPSQNFNMALADEMGEASALAASTGISRWSLTLTGNGEPTVLDVQVVDAAFFQVFGVSPVVGRLFTREARDPALSDVIVLSHGVWQTRFGGDPDVVGRRIDLDGAGHTTRRVIGVLPKSFVPPLVGPGSQLSGWIPLSRAAERTVATDSTWYVNNVIARMTPGATVDQLTQQIRAITARLQEKFPGVVSESRLQSAGAIGLLESVVGDVRTPLLALLGAVGLVMLLACANLANLLLARGERRRRELAVRAALGAGRGRLLREQLTDSVVLALLGGVTGVALARVLLTTLDLGRASALPRTAGLAMDWRVLAFALLVSLGAAVIFGFWPALRATQGDLRDDLGAGNRTPGLTRAGSRLGALLVAAEIALATVLVTGAGLLLKSLHELRSTDPGLDPSDVIAMHIAPPELRYQGEAARTFYRQLLERLRAEPGVRTAGAIHLLPLTLGNWSFPYLAEGHTPPPGPLPSANFRVITPSYFDVVDQPLLEGRFLTEADQSTERLTYGLVNHKMARELWPDESALGKTIELFGSQPFEVVGVVGDVRQLTLDREPQREMYVPHGAGWSLSSMVVMLETTGDPMPVMAAARRAVWELDNDVPIVSVQRMEEVVNASMSRRRFFAGVLTFFGALALALGAVGVFGVMAYTMGARRTEFGIRMALGAERARVLSGAVRRGAAPIAAGLTVGLATSVAASRLLESLLFGVTPGDPATVLSAGVVLAMVAAAATFIPAYRATQVDAARVMRAE